MMILLTGLFFCMACNKELETEVFTVLPDA